MASDLYLPEDCWEHVIKFLNHRSLESLSVVSKKFLSITNRCRSSFKIYDPTIPFLPGLFHRFTNLTSLDLTCFHGDLDTLLSQISFSTMHLKSLDVSNHYIPKDGFQSLAAKMKTLTSLICSNMRSIGKTDHIIIAECFPFLEELDISFPKTIESNTNILSLALPKLRKVNLSGNYYIDDSFLFHICKNCEFLEDIILFDCNYLTNVGIASAIRERPNLKSFSISFCKIGENQRMYVSSKMISSLRNLKGLTCLDLSSARISDHLLSSLAEQGLTLKRLSLKNSMDYSYAGIFCLLSKCQFLQHLDLQNSFILNDQYLAELSLVLGNLVSINLSHCNITELTLLALVRNCPFLSEIRMEHSGIGKFCDKNCNSLMDFVVYPQVKSLHLADSPCLKNENIKMMASLFPNLQVLDLRYCHWSRISEGIVEVLRCCKITHLNLSSWSTLNLLSMNFQIPKLEVLNLSKMNLSKTKIDDDTLYVISKSCCGLLKLDLELCDHITEKGVRHVVENCTRLREINIRGCHEVCADVDFWMVMVLSRPSLRKIMAPFHFCPRDDKWKPLLNHGCLVF